MTSRHVARLSLCCLLILFSAEATITLMADEPETPNVLMNNAVAASSAGQHEAAIALALQAVAAENDNPAMHYQQATILETAGRWADAVEAYTVAIGLSPRQAALYDGRGGAFFKQGEIEKSIADFDRAIELEPRREENHWRRGIALYYAGRFKEGSRQFELGKTVYANDVENAVWRFVCQARDEGVEKARAGLLKIGNDRRVPLMEVYALFRQQASPEDVLAAAAMGDPEPGLLKQQMFYAHLYLGLYFESHDKPIEAERHIRQAAETFPLSSNYMWNVARVHAERMKKTE